MARLADNTIPISGPDNPDRVYLEVIARANRRLVEVQPGPSRRRLPSFWMVWLRELIVGELAGPHTTYNVEIKNQRVLVSSPNGFDKAMAVAVAAAGQIYQLPACPLVRRSEENYPVDKGTAVWRVLGTERTFGGVELGLVTARRQFASEVVAGIELPGQGAKLWMKSSFHFNGDKAASTEHDELVLRRPAQGCPLSLSQLAKLVEMHFTLAEAKVKVPLGVLASAG